MDNQSQYLDPPPMEKKEIKLLEQDFNYKYNISKIHEDYTVKDLQRVCEREDLTDGGTKGGIIQRILLEAPKALSEYRRETHHINLGDVYFFYEEILEEDWRGVMKKHLEDLYEELGWIGEIHVAEILLRELEKREPFLVGGMRFEVDWEE